MESQRPASHSFHEPLGNLANSRRDSHIPTASATKTDGKVENQKHVSHFPTATDSLSQEQKNTRAGFARGSAPAQRQWSPFPPPRWFPVIPPLTLRDRDRIFGDDFTKQVRDMGIQEVLSAPRSPWQRAYVERVIGSIRRECLDHMIVFNEASLHQHVKVFVSYYHQTRTHLSLAKETPETRPVHPPELGPVVAIAEVGGRHHRYERRAA